jgi:hypothetical protein
MRTTPDEVDATADSRAGQNYQLVEFAHAPGFRTTVMHSDAECSPALDATTFSQESMAEAKKTTPWRTMLASSVCSVLPRIVLSVVGLGVIAGGGTAAAPTAFADQSPPPPYHVLSSQDLCNLVWPASQAMPDPNQVVGTICIRPGGLLQRLARAFPAEVSNTFKLAPGSAVQLPLASVRINPTDPLSDWLIPDCYIPNRLDCN